MTGPSFKILTNVKVSPSFVFTLIAQPFFPNESNFIRSTDSIKPVDNLSDMGS